MPFQPEQNKVSPFTTHPYYSVELCLDENFTNTFMLERRSILAKDLTRFSE